MPFSYSDDDDIDDQERENEVIRILQRGISDSSAEPVPILLSAFSSRSISDGDLFITQHNSPGETFTRESAIDVLQSGSTKKRKAYTRAKRKTPTPTQTGSEQPEHTLQPVLEEERPKRRMRKSSSRKEDSDGQNDRGLDDDVDEEIDDALSVGSSHSETSLVLREAELQEQRSLILDSVDQDDGEVISPPSSPTALAVSAASRMPPPPQLPTTRAPSLPLPSTSSTLASMGMIRPPVGGGLNLGSASGIVNDNIFSQSNGPINSNPTNSQNSNLWSMSFSVDVHDDISKNIKQGGLQRQIAQKKFGGSSLGPINENSSGLNNSANASTKQISFADSTSQKYPSFAPQGNYHQQQHQPQPIVTQGQPYPKPLGISVNTSLANTLTEQRWKQQPSQAPPPTNNSNTAAPNGKSSSVVVTPSHLLGAAGRTNSNGSGGSSGSAAISDVTTAEALELKVADLTESQVHHLIWQHYSGFTPSSGGSTDSSGSNAAMAAAAAASSQFRVTGADLVYVEDMDDLKELGFGSLPKVKLRRIVQDLKSWRDEHDGYVPGHLAAILIQIGRDGGSVGTAIVANNNEHHNATVPIVDESEYLHHQNNPSVPIEEDKAHGKANTARSSFLQKQSGERRNFSAILQASSPHKASRPTDDEQQGEVERKPIRGILIQERGAEKEKLQESSAPKVLTERECLYFCQLKLAQESAAISALVGDGVASNSKLRSEAMPDGSPSALSMMVHLLKQNPSYHHLCKLLGEYLMRELPIQKSSFFLNLVVITNQNGSSHADRSNDEDEDSQVVPRPQQVSELLFSQLHLLVVEGKYHSNKENEKEKERDGLILMLLKCLRLLWSIFDNDLASFGPKPPAFQLQQPFQQPLMPQELMAIEVLVALIDSSRYLYHAHTEIMFHYSGFMKVISVKKSCRDALFFPIVQSISTSMDSAKTKAISNAVTNYAGKMVKALRIHYQSNENLVKCYTATIRYFAAQDSAIQQAFGEGIDGESESSTGNGISQLLADMLKAYRPFISQMSNPSNGVNPTASTSMIVTMKQIFSLVWTISLFPANKIFMYQVGMCEILMEYLTMIHQEKPSNMTIPVGFNGVATLLSSYPSAALQLLHPIVGSIWTLTLFPNNRDSLGRLNVCESLATLLKKSLALVQKVKQKQFKQQRNVGNEKDKERDELEVILTLLIDQLCGAISTLAEYGENHKKLNVYGVCELLVEVLQCYCTSSSISTGRSPRHGSSRPNKEIAESTCKAIAAMIDGEKGEVTIFARDCLLGTNSFAAPNSSGGAGLSCFDLLLDVFQGYLYVGHGEVVRQVCQALKAILLLKAKSCAATTKPHYSHQNNSVSTDNSGKNTWQHLNILILQGLKHYVPIPQVLYSLLSVLQVSTSIPANTGISAAANGGALNGLSVKITQAMLGLSCDSADDMMMTSGEMRTANIGSGAVATTLLSMMELLQQILELYCSQGQPSNSTCVDVISSLCEIVTNITTAICVSNGGSSNHSIISLANLSSSSGDSFSTKHHPRGGVFGSVGEGNAQLIAMVSTFATQISSIAIQMILPLYKKEESVVLSITKLLKITGLPVPPTNLTLAALSSSSLASASSSSIASVPSLGSRSNGNIAFGEGKSRKGSQQARSVSSLESVETSITNNATNKYYQHVLVLMLEVLKTFKQQMSIITNVCWILGAFLSSILHGPNANSSSSSDGSTTTSGNGISAVTVTNILSLIPFTGIALELLTIHKSDMKALLPLTWMIANASISPILVKQMTEQGIMPSLLRISLIHIRTPAIIKYVSHIVKAITAASTQSAVTTPQPGMFSAMSTTMVMDTEALQTITLMYFTFLDTILPNYHHHKNVMKAVIAIFNNLLSPGSTTTQHCTAGSGLILLRDEKTMEEKKRYLGWLTACRDSFFPPSMASSTAARSTLSADDEKFLLELNTGIAGLEALCR